MSYVRIKKLASVLHQILDNCFEKNSGVGLGYWVKNLPKISNLHRKNDVMVNCLYSVDILIYSQSKMQFCHLNMSSFIKNT